jgi:hypothetical protein
MTKILPYIDCALMDHKTKKSNPLFKDIALTLEDSPKEVAKKLYESRVICIHPDGFDEWSDILVILEQKKKLPIKLIIITCSDFYVDDEILEILFAFLPNTKFWISNYIGCSDKVEMLPLGISTSYNNEIIKKCNFGISYVSATSESRKIFLKYLDDTPSIKEYVMPKMPHDKFLEALASLRFTLAPMGNGFDTGRFWESIMVKTIPIVENIEYYQNLKERYPNLPFIILDTWEELINLKDSLTEEKYNEMMEHADRNVIIEDYWLEKLNKNIS